MQCDFWQVEEAVSHSKSHVVCTDELRLSANPFQVDLIFGLKILDAQP